MKRFIAIISVISILTIAYAQTPSDSCLITSVPYMENFNSCSTISIHSFPPCWYRYTRGLYTYSNNFRIIESDSCKVLRIRPDSLAIIVLPKIDSTLLATDSLQLRLSLTNNVSTQALPLRFGVMTDPTDTTTFMQVSRYPLSNNTDHYNIIIPLSDLPTLDGHPTIIFNHLDVTIDIYQVFIERTPYCGTVHNLQCVTRAIMGAKLQWEHTSPASAAATYTIRVYPHFDGVTLPPDTSIIVSDTTSDHHYIIHGLTAGTPYTAVVTASCPGDTVSTTSQWDFINFQTATSISSCPTPTIVRMELDSTSATFEWIPNIIDVSWRIYYTIGSSNNEIELEYAYSDSVYTLQELEPGQEYNLFIRPLCSRNSTHVNFTTVCSPTTPLPYFCNFDNQEARCWDIHPQQNGLSFNYQYDNHQISAVFNNSTYYVLPYFSEPLASTRISGEINNGNIIVGILPSDDTSSFIPFDTIFSTTYDHSYNWTYFTVYFDNYPDSIGRIALKCYSSHVSFDNLLVDAIPSCVLPYNLTATTITPTSAQIEWSHPDNLDNYIIEYGPRGFSHFSGTSLYTIDDTITLSPLLPYTNYDVYIGVQCTDDSIYWSYPCHFTTPCADITHLPYIEDFDHFTPSSNFTYQHHPCWYSSNYENIIYYDPQSSDTTNNYYFIRPYSYICMPVIDPDSIQIANTKLSFTAWNISSPFYNDTASIQIGFLSDPENLNTFTPYTNLCLNTIPTRYDIPFNNYNNTGLYIAFVYNTRGPSWFYLDDVILDTLPTCQHPFNPTLLQVSTNSALIAWRSQTPATAFQISFGPTGFTPGQTSSPISLGHYGSLISTDDTILITGLHPATHYDVYVRSICTPGDTSSWTLQPIHLLTIQNPATVPYYCNFENPIEARRWSTASTNDHAWRYDIFPDDTNNRGYFVTTANSNNSLTAILFRDFNFGTPDAPTPVADSSLQITFRARLRSTSTLSYPRIYVFLVDPQLPIVFPENININRWRSTPSIRCLYNTDSIHPLWSTHTINLDTLQGLRRLVFYVSSPVNTTGPSDTSLFIDDVQISTIPCPRPHNIYISQISDTSATLAWHGDPSASYLLTYRTIVNYPDTSDTVSAIVTTNTARLNGLIPLSTYSIVIQRFCTDGSLTDPSSKFTFTTPICNGWISDTAAIGPTDQVHTSSLLPIAYYQDNSYSQQIYPASSFNGPGSIQSINLHCQRFYTESWHNRIQVYLGHTIRSQFDSTQTFIDPQQLQLVYYGPNTYKNGWSHLTLQTPFYYDGTSNLILAVLCGNNPAKPTYYYIADADRPTALVLTGSLPIEPISLPSLQSYHGTKTLLSSLTQATFDFCEPPACPPVQLKIPNLRYSQVTLRWNDTPSPEYRVDYRFDSESWQTVHTTDTSVILTDIFPDQLYTYRVSPSCSDEALPIYSYGTFRTSSSDCPFPDNLHIEEIGSDYITFAWTPDENNIRYQLHIYNDTFDTVFLTYLARKQVFNLNSNTPYSAQVMAYCTPDEREGQWSDPLLFFTEVCPTPSALTVTDIQGNSVTLDWRSTDLATGWEIQYGLEGFDQGRGTNIIADTHPFTLTGLTGETVYQAYVRSLCGDTLVSERWRGPITFKTLYSDIISPSGTVPFTLVPNPATDRVEILFGSDMPTHYSLTLRDAHGRIVANTTGTTLQLGGLPSGVYFATLTTPFTTATRKLIIQHK